MTLAYLSTAYAVLALLLGVAAADAHSKDTSAMLTKWMWRCVALSVLCCIGHGIVIDYERELLQHYLTVIP